MQQLKNDDDEVPEIEIDTPRIQSKKVNVHEAIIQYHTEEYKEHVNQQDEDNSKYTDQKNNQQIKSNNQNLQSQNSNISQSVLQKSKSQRQFKLSIKSLSKKLQIQQMSNQKVPRSEKEIWQASSFIIICLVSKILLKLKRTLLFLRPQQLTAMQLRAIRDRSAKSVQDGWGVPANISIDHYLKRESQMQRFFGNAKRLKQYKIIKKKIKQTCQCLLKCLNCTEKLYQRVTNYLEQNIPIFDPLSKVYAIWQLMVSFIMLYNFVHIPLFLCFKEIQFKSSIFMVQIVSPVFLSVDIVVQANTSFYDKHNSITNHKDIFVRYLRSTLFFDIISLFFLIFMDPQINQLYLNNINEHLMLIFFIRMFYFRNILTIIRQQWSINYVLQASLKFIFLLAKIFLVIHFFSCSFYKLGKYELDEEHNQDSWLFRQNILADTNFYIKYLTSFYIITQSLYSVQIEINSSNEQLFFIIIRIFFIVAFGYILRSVNNILSQLDKYEQKYDEMLDDVNYYLATHEISQPLQRRVKKCIEYEYKQELSHRNNIRQHGIDSLSNKFLREEILQEVNLKILKKVKLFKNNFNNTFLQKLAIKMKEQVYGPQQLILQQNSQEQPCFHIITKGEVEIYIETGGTEYGYSIQQNDNQISNSSIHSLRLLEKFDYFGELEFFTQEQQNRLSARSTCVTTIHKIYLNDFLELCAPNSEERETYCYIKDRLLFERQYNAAKISCFSCTSSNHFVLDCPYLFYGQDKDLIIAKYKKEIDLTIISFKRKAKQKFQALSKLKELKEKLYLFVQNNIQYLIEKNKIILNDYYDDDDDDDEDYEDSEDNSNYSNSDHGLPTYIQELREEEEEDQSPSNSIQNMIEQEMKLNLMKVGALSKQNPKSDKSLKNMSSCSIKNKIQDVQESYEDPDLSRTSIMSINANIKSNQEVKHNFDSEGNSQQIQQNKSMEQIFEQQQQQQQLQKKKSKSILQQQQQSQLAFENTSQSNIQTFNNNNNQVNDENLIADIKSNSNINISEEQLQQQIGNSSKSFNTGSMSKRLSTSKKLSQFSEQNNNTNNNNSFNSNNQNNNQEQINFVKMLSKQKSGTLNKQQQKEQYDARDDISNMNIMKNYSIYFPEYNVDKVIEQFNTKIRKKLKKNRSKTIIKRKLAKTSHNI